MRRWPLLLLLLGGALQRWQQQLQAHHCRPLPLLLAPSQLLLLLHLEPLRAHPPLPQPPY